MLCHNTRRPDVRDLCLDINKGGPQTLEVILVAIIPTGVSTELLERDFFLCRKKCTTFYVGLSS